MKKDSTKKLNEYIDEYNNEVTKKNQYNSMLYNMRIDCCRLCLNIEGYLSSIINKPTSVYDALKEMIKNSDHFTSVIPLIQLSTTKSVNKYDAEAKALVLATSSTTIVTAAYSFLSEKYSDKKFSSKNQIPNIILTSLCIALSGFYLAKKNKKISEKNIQSSLDIKKKTIKLKEESIKTEELIESLKSDELKLNIIYEDLLSSGNMDYLDFTQAEKDKLEFLCKNAENFSLLINEYS